MPHSDHSETDMHFLPVIITMVAGERLKGEVAIPTGKKLGDVLNSSDQFLVFRINEGELIYLAQNTIAIVQSNQLPKARQLEAHQAGAEHAKPHEILEISKTAGRAVARKAYHQKIRQYHPDQFRNIDLPKEVKDYLEAMVLRLNAAYKDFIDDLVRREEMQRLQALKERQQQESANGIHYFGQ